MTLLGEAAHFMPPVGVVNLAMLDAYELALALTRAATVDESPGAYEQTRLPRSADWSTAADRAAGLPFDRDDSHEGDARRESSRERSTDERRRNVGAHDGHRGRRGTVELVLLSAGETLNGTFDGRHISEDILQVAEVTFTASITSPAKAELKCSGTLDGAR